MSLELIKRVVPLMGEYDDAVDLKKLFGDGHGVVSGKPVGKDISEGQVHGVDFMNGQEVTAEELRKAVKGTRFEGVNVMVEFIPQARELTL